MSGRSGPKPRGFRLRFGSKPLLLLHERQDDDGLERTFRAAAIGVPARRVMTPLGLPIVDQGR